VSKKADNFRSLVADIGGTNMRVALAGRGEMQALQTFASDEVSDPGPVLADYAAAAGGIRRAVIAVAGPVEGERFSLTNRPWRSSVAELQNSLKVERVIVVNDFAAMAHSIAGLEAGDLASIRSGVPVPDGNVLVCGPGTGFGVSLLVQGYAVATEAGHMSLGAVNEEEFDIFAKLQQGSAPLAIEDVLSGRGFAALEHALNGSPRKPVEIIAAGDKASKRTLRMFMTILGRVVGDLALAFEARGGIFIGGGLGLALRSFYSMPEFHAAYEQHEPYADRLRQIPISLIAHPFPGLIGAAEIARRQFTD
jgi:glucokinase